MRIKFRLHSFCETALTSGTKRTSDSEWDPGPPKKIPKQGEDDLSLRGVTEGSVPLGPGQEPLRSVVLGDSLPSWLVWSNLLGIRAERVLLKNTAHVETVYHLCGPETQVWSGSDWNQAISLWPFCGMEVLCLVDGHVTQSLLKLLEGRGIENVLSTHRPRGLMTGWHMAAFRAEHCGLGGVTV